MKPIPCQLGGDDAQAATAWSFLAMNILTLFCNPVVGSIGDKCGRRRILILSLFFWSLAPIALVVVQLIPSMDPAWYYVAYSLVGVVDILSVNFAILSDVVQERFRAQSFGLIMASWYGGLTFSPSFALVMNHFEVSILSVALMISAMLVAVATMPETLPDEALNRAHIAHSGNFQRVATAVLSPFRALSILNRSWMVRLVAVGSFFASMVFATDRALVVYYIEYHLNVGVSDVAGMFFVMGIIGIIIQVFMMQPLLNILGEKRLLVLTFISGTIHNVLYGVAKAKSTIYVAFSLSQLTKINISLLSSLASKTAAVHEQGRIQGALFAVNALANAIGPVSSQFVYNRTKDSAFWGPGTMFLYAAFLYVLGLLSVSFVLAEDNAAVELEPSQDLGNRQESQEGLEQSLLPGQFAQPPYDSVDCVT